MAANRPSGWVGEDKSYVAETTDGGKSFHFVSWIAPLSSRGRAVMPAVCRLKDGSIVATMRCNRVERDAKGEGFMAGHVDAYGSADNGKTWSFLSRVGETGGSDAERKSSGLGGAQRRQDRLCLWRPKDGTESMIRLSSDGGKTWGDELVLRDDFQRGQRPQTRIWAIPVW